jgi:Domain of unknown function (DUF1816)
MKFITAFLHSNYPALRPEELPMKIAEYLTSTLNFLGLAWWIQVVTSEPPCTYYFGPFANAREAQLLMNGYIADLESESAQGIQAQIKRCRPNRLTIDGENERPDHQPQVSKLEIVDY